MWGSHDSVELSTSATNSVKARISLSAGRLEETFTIQQRNPKRKAELDMFI